MAAELEINKISWRGWFAGNTEFESIKNRLLDEPSEGFSAWARTTVGVVGFLFVLQFLTGILLAFHYVPSAENAYATVAFIEQAVGAGTWIRSLHYHSSVLLPIALLAHLAQMIFRNLFKKNPIAWTFSLIFLALVLAAGATGYALPWDARSLNGVNVAVSLAGNAPLIGETLQSWLQNGETISTMTISRFYGLHVFATPALILICIVARLFIFGKNGKQIDAEKFREWSREQLVRNAIVIGLIFLGLAAFSAKFPAPFAPAAAESASYLPRPGPQFLWLFEMQKYTEGQLAAILAFGLPALIIGGLVLIPRFGQRVKYTKYVVSTLFAIALAIVGGLTATAYVQDASDSRIAEQLSKQEKEENDFRLKTFKPKVIRVGKQENKNELKPESNDSKSISPLTAEISETVEIPKSYVTNCAKCHGANAEGKGVFPELHGLTTREEEKRSDEDLLGIINNPSSFGLSSKMPSYEHKLTEDQKREIIRWIKTLK